MQKAKTKLELIKLHIQVFPTYLKQSTSYGKALWIHLQSPQSSFTPSLKCFRKERIAFFNLGLLFF